MDQNKEQNKEQNSKKLWLWGPATSMEHAWKPGPLTLINDIKNINYRKTFEIYKNYN